MNIIEKAIPSNALFNINNKTTTRSLIKDVALASLKELAVSLCMVGVSAFFITNPASLSILMIGAIGVVALNTLIRSGSAFYTYEYLKTGNKEALKLGNLLQFLCPISFSILDLTTREVVVHEMGHALATKIVYQNPRTTIEVSPPTGGVTRFVASSLTKFGEVLGKETSRTIVTAAGPAFGILLALKDILIAHKVQKNHPLLSRYLITTAIVNIANHVLYALSALWKVRAPGHDFLFLAAKGIHPAVSILIMVGAPLLLKCSLVALDSLSAGWGKAQSA